jgi:SAM-dependent methyltransferase
MSEQREPDPYRRVDYRRMIAWPARIEREAPFLRAVLATAPEASVLDLGCGTGEHADFLAAEGFWTVGIDRSEAQIDKAREYEGRRGEAGPRFLLGDFTALAEATGERFGCAIWLGNGLPHLEDDELATALTQLSRRLLPGGVLLIQLLNYERIRRQGIRHLPLNFRDDPAERGEIVFLRLMTLDGPSHVRFNPMTLVLRPGAEPSAELKGAREVRLRTWSGGALEAALGVAGFSIRGTYGDMIGGDYDAERSTDLVMVGALSTRRRSSHLEATGGRGS